jgi:DNA-binding response OmpR family regulator
MKKILVVEDDPKISMALGVRLRAHGYEVIVAFDAMIGLSQAVKQRPDLVILDVSMPAGNGFIVAERIQNLATTAGTPMIFITASKDPAFKTRAEELGAVAFLEKPFESEKILAAVQQALG